MTPAGRWYHSPFGQGAREATAGGHWFPSPRATGWEVAAAGHW
jgi:hypothetical protein